MRGDTAVGHVDAHNELRSGILREAERFGVLVDIGGPYSIGDPGHIQEHNKATQALAAIANTAGITIDLPTEHAFGDAGHAPVDHDLLAQALAVISKADAWNRASGGIITDVDNYNGTGQRWRVHRFDADETLVVQTAARDFRVMVCGGGGPGGPVNQGGSQRGGGGGGGGGFLEVVSRLALGNIPVQVGGSGSGRASFLGDYARADGGNGGYEGGGGGGSPGGNSGAPTSHAGGQRGGAWGSCGGGGAGGDGQDTNGQGTDSGYFGSDGGPGLTTTISGEPTSWGYGGHGGGHNGNGSPGGPGVVFIAYQIGVAA